MSALWDHSLKTENDINGKPMVGCQAFFYDQNTTTPQVVYSDSALATAIDQPVETDQYGRWPAVFLNANPGNYRSKVLDPASALLWDVDGISVPQDADYVPPDAGSTDPTLLLATGMIVQAHGTSAIAGFVRANGRTIGNASSGAAERANADTSALYQYLWNQDSTLAVSGGRGATAAGDFAANKTIALPDYRGRALIARGSMGGSAAGLIPDAAFDNSETADTLGATVGEGTHTLSTAETPAHTHSGTTGTESQGHTHTSTMYANGNFGSGAGTPTNLMGGNNPGASATTAASNGESATHTHTFTTSSVGSGSAHNNVQPSVAVTIYLKL